MEECDASSSEGEDKVRDDVVAAIAGEMETNDTVELESNVNIKGSQTEKVTHVTIAASIFTFFYFKQKTAYEIHQ